MLLSVLYIQNYPIELSRISGYYMKKKKWQSDLVLCKFQ